MDMWHADVNAVTADLRAAMVAFNPMQLPSTLPRCVFFQVSPPFFYPIKEFQK
jgi:hypothetical protein